MRRFPALFTRRLTQVRKNFQDGFVDIEELPSGKVVVKVVDAEQVLVERATVGEWPPLDGSDFRVGGYLVQIYGDEKVSVQKVVEKPVFKPSRSVLPRRTEPGAVRVVDVRIRTVDEVIKLYEEAVADLKHDMEKIRSNLAEFLE